MNFEDELIDDYNEDIDNTELSYTGKNICIRLNNNEKEKRNKLKTSETVLCKKFNEVKKINSEDRLEEVINNIFIEGFNKRIYIRNLTFTNKKNGYDVRILAIRPEIYEGDYLYNLLGEGNSLLLKGHILGKEFIVDSIYETADTEQLDFEVDCIVTPYRNPEMVHGGNFLYDIIDEANSLTEYTGEKLQEWKEYLEWKKELAKCQIFGCKYYKVTFDEERTRLVFWLVCEDKEYFHAFKRYLGREIQVFDNNYSKDKWRFEFSYDDKRKIYNSIEIGRYRGILDEYYLKDFVDQYENNDNEEYQYTNDDEYYYDEYDTEDENDIYDEFENPYIVKVMYDLNRSDLDDINQKNLEGDEIIQYIYDNILGNYYSDGFLALSAVGEFVLINRFEQAINQLERDECYSPNLAMWLFNVEKARLPKTTQRKEISKWLNKNIETNENQKIAVYKMMEAPDLCLIQGPPGTGKTTVIAEAIYQFVRNGDRVLIASQSNDAVDNALERLADSPEIRAIRLGQKGRKKRKHIDLSKRKFSEDEALKYYYNSLSLEIKKLWLDVWDKLEYDSLTYDKDIRDAKYFNEDIEKLIEELGKENENLKKARNDYRYGNEMIENANKHNMDLQNEINQFSIFKDNCKSNLEENFYLSDNELVIIEKQLNPVINYAKENGIFLINVEDNILSKKTMKLNDENAYINIALKNIGILKSLKSKVYEFRGGTVENNGEISLLSRQLEEVKEKILKYVRDGDFDSVNKYDNKAKDIQYKIEKIKFSSSKFLIEETEKRILSEEFLSKLDEIKEKNIIIESIDNVIFRFEEAINNIIEEIENYLSSKKKINVEAIKIDLERFEAKYVSIKERVEEINKKIETKKKTLHTLCQKYGINRENSKDIINFIRSKKDKNLQELESKKEFRDEWEDTLRDFYNRLNNKDSFEYDKEYYQQIYINACNVVGISCTDNMRNLTDNGYDDFDVVIIDEVSKATPPELLIPLMKARKAILVGDHRQLPPMFKEHEGSYKELLQNEESIPQEIRSLLTQENFRRFKNMVTSSLFKEYFENANDRIKHSLLVQYRMHSDIMEIINRFYDGRLKAGLNEQEEATIKNHGLTIKGEDGSSFIISNRHAYWIDSSTLPSGKPIYETFINKSTSANNILEKYIIIELLKKIAIEYSKQGYKNGNKKTVGVISFYQMQVNELRDAFRKEKNKFDFSSIEVDINTVDRFQGKEKNIIITSLVRNNKVARASKHVVAFERINVAFSRAQELLIIVGAKHMYENSKIELPNMDMPGFKTVPAYKNIMEDLNRKASFKNSNKLINNKLEQEIISEYVENGGRI